MTPPGGAPPQGGAPSPMAPPPEQPAGGAGGATMPTPNRGIEAQAIAKLKLVAQQLALISGIMPVGSEAARDMREALNKISKHIPEGAVSQGVQMSQAQQQLMQTKQQAPQIAAMRAAQPAGGAPPPPSPQPQAA